MKSNRKSPKTKSKRKSPKTKSKRKSPKTKSKRKSPKTKSRSVKNLPQATFKNDYVYIDNSKIKNAGKGVFAKVDIKKGKRICDYYGKMMSWGEKKQLYGDETNYIYQMKRVGKAIVARERPYLTNNISNYINEGRVANVELKLKGLYSKKDIKYGEELYLQYPKSYNRYWLKYKL